MNKKTALTALILCAGLALTACTAENNPLSSLFENEQSTTTTSDGSEITTDAPIEPETTTTTTADETTDSNSDASGGNPDISDYIEVTVSEDKYFYENHEISFDDLMKVFDELEENTAVKISDENATLKAYESLINALEEREILIVEES